MISEPLNCVNLLNPMSARGFVVCAEVVRSDEARRAARCLLYSQSRRNPLCWLVVDNC